VARGVGESCVGGVSRTNPDLSLGSRHGMICVGAAGSRRTTGASEGHPRRGGDEGIEQSTTSILPKSIEGV